MADVTKPTRVIRKAILPDDADAILTVFAAAKTIMRDSGNVNQWVEGYPSLDAVRSDAERGGAYVVEDDGRVVAYFAFLQSPEPTYAIIYDGQWLDTMAPYHVIHRMASLVEAHGIFRSVMDYCFEREGNIRIDTHEDNRIMRHNIIKYGFTYCGIIFLASGAKRLAYQRIIIK